MVMLIARGVFHRPKPPSSPHWAPVDSPTFEAQSVCLAVAFTDDGVTGFAGAGSNGEGAQIIKSSDSGKTWTAVPDKPDFNIYLDAAVGSPLQLLQASAKPFETFPSP